MSCLSEKLTSSSYGEGLETGPRSLLRQSLTRQQDYQQLKEELGLDHYEGRSWIGWHHHTTLVMLAHAFLTLEMLRSKKNFWLDPATDAP